MDCAGHGVSEFRFFVADAVAADDGASRFHHFRKTACKDAFENSKIGLVGKTYQRERGEWTASHGINVAERIRGGNLTEGVWIVDDGREEIDGLNQRLVGH